MIRHANPDSYFFWGGGVTPPIPPQVSPLLTSCRNSIATNLLEVCDNLCVLTWLYSLRFSLFCMKSLGGRIERTNDVNGLLTTSTRLLSSTDLLQLSCFNNLLSSCGNLIQHKQHYYNFTRKNLTSCRSLPTSCVRTARPKLSTSLGQAVNGCDNLVDIVRLVARLFQQVRYNHDITILFQLSIANRVTRLLARVLKEGVQFWYNDTSTVKRGRVGGGGVRKTFLWKTFEVYVTSCQYMFQVRSKFSNTLAFVSLCRYASLLNYDIFIQSGTPSNWSKCQMYNTNENWG
jgi:hypothetical protein